MNQEQIEKLLNKFGKYQVSVGDIFLFRADTAVKYCVAQLYYTDNESFLFLLPKHANGSSDWKTLDLASKNIEVPKSIQLQYDRWWNSREFDFSRCVVRLGRAELGAFDVNPESYL